MRLDTLLAALAGGALLAVALTVNRRRAQAPPLPEPEPEPTSTGRGDDAADAVPAAAAGPEEAPSTASRPRRVAVLLPVRDEEDNLDACLDTLLAQTERPEVLVIDDGSTDATLPLARRRAAGEPRLTVLDAGPLPPGWGGKVHALAVGHRHLAERPGGPPEWLLSTDADARHHPRLLARTLAAARRHGLDLVSIAGRQEVEGAGENLLTPPVFALLDAVLGDWRRAATGHGPPIANGQLLLVREAALARAGGFAALAGVAIDDVGLAVRVRAAGGATGFWRAPDLLTVRMYRGAARVAAGWRRNLGGLFGPRPATAATAAALALAPTALALASLAAHRPAPAALAWTTAALASALLRHGSGHSPAWGLAYPADALAVTATLALGIADWRRGRLAAWKGRPVPASR